MASVPDLRAGIKTRLETLTGLVAVYDYEPDRLVEPSAAVSFSDCEYNETSSSSGVAVFRFVVTVLAARWESTAGQTILDGYISGGNSVPAAIDGDPTLDASALTSRATGCRSYGMLTVADSQYWGAQFDLEVIA